MKAKVLYVDDEELNLTTFRAVYRRDFEVYTALSPQEGLLLIDENPDMHVVISDQKMPDMTGVEFLELLVDKHPDPIRMLLTGYTDMSAVVDAINKGRVYNYLVKPWNNDELRLVIEKAIEVFELRKENHRLTTALIEANSKLEFMIRQKNLS
jgi:response regulator RpfG family c-di-GMP phosphodiesterase